MLSFLRRRKRSWIIVFLLGAIVFVFVLWGVGSYVTQPRVENVARVNQDVISAGELEFRYQEALETYRDIFRGNLSREAIERLNLRSSVLDGLIQERLLLQEAHRLGLETTDEELMESIANNPAFQIGGRFSKNLYLRFLRSRRLTPQQFETEQKNQLTIRKLYDMVQDSVHVTEAEVKNRFQVEREKINLYFIRLAAKDFMGQVRVTPDEIEKAYQRNREAFREPLKVRVEYLTYPFAHFASREPVPQEEIEKYYNTYRETKFRQPRAVRLRHILFRVAPGADLEERRLARQRAERVLREARAGKDFARLAREHSQDPSASQGGDVGFLTEGQLLPALEKVAFSLKRGEISGVVETPSGFHILKVEEIREERIRQLSEVKEEITRTLQREREKEAAIRAVESDREKALDGTPLSRIAKDRGLSLKVSPFFTRNEVLKEFGPVRGFNRTAFSLIPKQISPILEGPKAFYLITLKERREPRIPPLAQIRADLEKRLKEKRAMARATQKARSLLRELQEKKSIKRLAQEHDLQLAETGWFLRGDTSIPKIGILREVQAGGIPISAEKPVPERVYTEDKTLYVFAFKEGRGADMKTFEEERERFRETLLAEKRQRALQSFIEALRAEAEIEVRPEYLAAS